MSSTRLSSFLTCVCIGTLLPLSARAEEALPAKYTELMHTIADPWARSVADAKETPHHIPAARWLPRLGQLGGSENPGVKAAVTRLEKAVEGSNAMTRGKAELNSRLEDSVAATREAAARGDFRVQRVDAGGRTVSMVDDGDSAVFKAEASRLFQMGFAAIGENMLGSAEQQLEVGRTDALAGLYNDFAKIYPPSPKQAGLVTPKIAHESISFTNTSGRALTGVTLYTEFANFMSSPDPMAEKVLYVDRLEPGESVHVSPLLHRNLWSKASKIGIELRPEISQKIRNREEGWLAMAGGVVEMKLTTWAVEAHDDRHSVPFPENQEPAARFELRSAMRALVRNQPKPNAFFSALAAGDFGPSRVDPLADRDWAILAAQRVLTFVPADSAMAKEARALIANPDAAAQRGRLQAAQEKLETARKVLALTTGTFSGDYSMVTAPVNYPQGAKIPENFGSRMSDVLHKNEHGQSALQIVGLTPDYKLKAYLSDPANPAQRRYFLGEPPDVEAGRGYIILNAVPKNSSTLASLDPNAPPPVQTAPPAQRPPAARPQPMTVAPGAGSGPFRQTGLGTVTLGGNGLRPPPLPGRPAPPQPAAIPIRPPEPARIDPPATPGPGTVNFNLCARTLWIELEGDKIDAYGESDDFQFKLALVRAPRPPTPPTPAEIAASQGKAMEQYPKLRDNASDLNHEFVALHQLYRTEKPAFFNDPEWPEKLAREADEAVSKKLPRK